MTPSPFAVRGRPYAGRWWIPGSRARADRWPLESVEPGPRSPTRVLPNSIHGCFEHVRRNAQNRWFSLRHLDGGRGYSPASLASRTSSPRWSGSSRSGNCLPMTRLASMISSSARPARPPPGQSSWLLLPLAHLSAVDHDIMLIGDTVIRIEPNENASYRICASLHISPSRPPRIPSHPVTPRDGRQGAGLAPLTCRAVLTVCRRLDRARSVTLRFFRPRTRTIEKERV